MCFTELERHPPQIRPHSTALNLTAANKRKLMAVTWEKVVCGKKVANVSPKWYVLEHTQSSAPAQRKHFKKGKTKTKK